MLTAVSSAPPTPPKRPSSRRIRAFAAGRPFGAYVLDERIAIGGTAEVYLAHPQDGERPAPLFVIKRLLSTLLDDPAARSMFAEEALLHRRFVHPNIVTCYGAGTVGDEPYLAMELVQGADLHRVLRVGQARKRAVPPTIATHIARQILAALGVVHSAASDDGIPLGIVHRDVSPSNIYLSTTGDVKLGDFGIAHAAAAASGSSKARTATGTAIRGKFAYLAPEQVASEPVDHRADLFAVANVLAEMMLGRPLFSGSGQLAVLLAIRDARLDALNEGAHGIPPQLALILRRALSRHPSDRFYEAASFAEALAPYAFADEAIARREVAQLVRWSRDASLELRALGKHPSDHRPIVSAAPPTSPDSSQATPVRSVPAMAAPGQLALDPFMLDSLEVRDVTPRPSDANPSQVRTAEFTPPPSRVRTVDGRQLGPLSYAKLMELVATGRIEDDDEVDFMGTGFVPLRDIDELARHVGPRSSTTKQITGPGTPDWHGLAAERFDPEIGGAIDPGIGIALSYVASRRATGVLLAQAQGRRKELYFIAGRLHHVSSSEAGELLGEYLVARGVLDRTDLDFALAVLPRFNGRIGEALTGLGLLAPVAMFKAIQEQGRDRVVDVFTWSEGELSFYAGEQPAKVDFPLDLAIGPIVEAGVAAMLDDSHATARYRPWIDRKIVAVEVQTALRDGGWSPRVDRALKVAGSPITIRALLRTLAADDASPHDAARAVEAARVVRMLDWA